MPHVDEKFKEFAKLNLAVDTKAFVRQWTRIVKAFKFITLRVCFIALSYLRKYSLWLMKTWFKIQQMVSMFQLEYKGKL